eukprot:g28849.t1
MPLQSSHVFASHIGHTGKTTLAYQMSTFFAQKHPDLTVLIMDLAEEGDLTKRLLGGVDAAAGKVESLPSGLTSWLWSSKFDVMEHAVKLKEHNPALPENLYLISSGAWPRTEAPMDDDVRKQVRKTELVLHAIAGEDKSAAANALVSALQDVDIVVDETYAPYPQAYSFATFLSTFGLTESSTQKFVSQKYVLRVDGTLSESDGLDWFESRVAYPDWAAEGLARYIRGDASQRRKYFRNIAANEEPEVLTAAMCAADLPSCNESSFAAPIDVASITQETELSGAAAAWAMLSTVTWKLFCDTDGDRRPSPYTLLAYGLCDQAIVPLHLNKGDLDRTETMLGVMHELRQRGEIQTQANCDMMNLLTIVACQYLSLLRRFAWTSWNPAMRGWLFVHTPESQVDFIKCSTAVLRVLADNVLKPSEELGLPVAEMESRITESGKKNIKFQSGDIAYDTKGETISNVMDGLKQLEEKFEAMSLS